ncbi:MAG: UbiA family prenyltransferase [Myxococcales bacterium]|nr:UbiA family prenyltransferase [Myxococcales bacterium]
MGPAGLDVSRRLLVEPTHGVLTGPAPSAVPPSTGLDPAEPLRLARRRAGSGRRSLNPYVEIARPDHWFKNVFLAPGFVAAAALVPGVDLGLSVSRFLVCIAVACIISSANYTLNEWLDAPHDRFHPTKRTRPAPSGRVRARWVWLQYAFLSFTGLALASTLGLRFMATSATLWIMGIVYNVPPIRSKDRVFIDVLSESFNNPLRLTMGWFSVPTALIPPSSLLVGYWMAGAFLMGMKRYAELRTLQNGQAAGLYRRSLGTYTPEVLLVSSFFYSLLSSMLLGVFLIKHRIELLLSVPLLAGLFTWYLGMAFKEESPVQNPERLVREPAFALYCAVTAAVTLLLMLVDVPPLRTLLEMSLQLPR